MKFARWDGYISLVFDMRDYDREINTDCKLYIHENMEIVGTYKNDIDDKLDFNTNKVKILYFTYNYKNSAQWYY